MLAVGSYRRGRRVDRSQSHNFRIGGGWGDATFLETSYPHDTNPFALVNHYSLRGNGTLSRWDARGGFGWTNPQSASGFAAVRTMALISQTATYDTFLATTRGGALYTIRLPLASPMKPVVKRVRDSTWQALDALIAEKCGQYGTLLLGIDKDTPVRLPVRRRPRERRGHRHQGTRQGTGHLRGPGLLPPRSGAGYRSTAVRRVTCTPRSAGLVGVRADGGLELLGDNDCYSRAGE